MSPTRDIALIMRGIALGFLFTPINNVAYANLKPSRGTAGIRVDQPVAPIRRIVRDRHHDDVSGSPGRHAQGDLVANTYIENPQLVARQSAAVAALMAHGYSAFQAKQGALAILDALGDAAGHDA